MTKWTYTSVDTDTPCFRAAILDEEGCTVADRVHGKRETRMILAAPRTKVDEVRRSIDHAEVVRVATKFPNTARRYFEGMGRQAEIIELHGSIELAPLVGLAEAVVDLTATGTTLRENDLVILDDIASSTARLIANRGSYRLRHGEVAALVEGMQRGGEPVG